jgi:hypothetical protein
MSWTKGMGVIMGELGDSIRRCEQNLQAATTQFSAEIREIKQRLQLLEGRVKRARA